MARFLGYQDWEAYLAALAARTDVESDMFQGEGITIDDLNEKDCVEVTWLPNRRCVFRYEGNACFVVLESKNAKLHVGDRSETASLFHHRQAYVP